MAEAAAAREAAPQFARGIAPIVDSARQGSALGIVATPILHLALLRLQQVPRVLPFLKVGVAR